MGKEMSTPSEEDLAYAAGFLDGEGCFTATTLNRRWKIVVAAENTNRPVIEWLHTLFGGCFSPCRTRRKANHRLTCRWAATGRDAHRVCAILAPYLKEKAPQALLLIAIQQTMSAPLIGRYINPDILAERIRLAALLKAQKLLTWDFFS
jgi:hypothetical protein